MFSLTFFSEGSPVFASCICICNPSRTVFVCDGGTDPDTCFLIRVFIDSTHLSGEKNSHFPLFCNDPFVTNQDAHKCFQTLVCSEVRSPSSHDASSALLQLHIRQWLQHRSFPCSTPSSRAHMFTHMVTPAWLVQTSKAHQE